ncbi:unnamed protein product [Prorocentrum cordatum]|uniref:Uncharacterized protein n=1 Tax=Prorocentrum cordatum TaxID=2364126 RepID=A0ABN9SAS6_9DINO|nr:unnamed protein product [Polarella glacialis]|mmetsp:Transcript_93813/g.265301  ORF Transcript_93813/g.265301 Transcript_93813/m.265301 type:complete len:713 (+) Transcript_93813:187-2325(+)
MQQAGDYQKGGPPPRGSSVTSEEGACCPAPASARGRRQGGCCPKARRRFFDEQQCTTGPCQWLSSALLWLVLIGAYFWVNHDLFRPLLFSSPVIIVLAISLSSSVCGLPGPPNCQKLGIFSVMMFLIYWTVYKTYGAQCRSAWAMVMLSDEDFRSNATKVEETIHEYLRDDFATSENDQFDDNFEKQAKSWLEAGSKLAKAAHVPDAPAGVGMADMFNSSARSEAPEQDNGSSSHSSTSSKSSSPSREWGVVAEQWGGKSGTSSQTSPASPISPASPPVQNAPFDASVAMDGEAAVEAAVQDAGEEWFKPWSNGDSLHNLLLRAYCLHHRRDPFLPHVYPLTKFGIGGHEVHFKLPCTFGTCVLTESRESGTGKLVYLWVLVGMGIFQWLHGRLTGLPNSACWQWLWACTLPLWTIALVQSTGELASLELPELVGYSMQSARDMVVHPFNGEWETSAMTTAEEKDAAIAMRDRDTEHIVFVTFLVAAVVAFCFRQKIGDFLGLHDWLPRFSLLGGSDRHEFQVCVWKVEPRGVPGDDGRGSLGLADGGGGGTSWPGWLFGGGSGPVGCMASPRAINRATLPFELTVHLTYAGDELKRSEKTRPAEEGLMVSNVYYVRECFKLNIETINSSDFIVEMRGIMGGNLFRSTVAIGPEMLDQAFRRSSQAHSQRIYEEQFGAMKNSRFEEDRMRSLGFQGYPGNNGGEIWLAFCDY